MENKYLIAYLQSLGFKAVGCLFKKSVLELKVGIETVYNASEIIEIHYTEHHFKVKRYYMYLNGTSTMIYYERLDLRVLYNIIELIYRWDGGGVL